MIRIIELQRVFALACSLGIPVELGVGESAHVHRLTRSIDSAVSKEFGAQVGLYRFPRPLAYIIEVVRTEDPVSCVGTADFVCQLTAPATIVLLVSVWGDEHLAVQSRSSDEIGNGVLEVTCRLVGRYSYVGLWLAGLRIYHQHTHRTVGHHLINVLQGCHFYPMIQRLNLLRQFCLGARNEGKLVTTNLGGCPQDRVAERLYGVMCWKHVFLAIDDHRLHITHLKPPPILFAWGNARGHVILEEWVGEFGQSVLQGSTTLVLRIFLQSLLQPLTATLSRLIGFVNLRGAVLPPTRQVFCHCAQTQVHLSTERHIGIVIAQAQKVGFRDSLLFFSK